MAGKYLKPKKKTIAEQKVADKTKQKSQSITPNQSTNGSSESFVSENSGYIPVGSAAEQEHLNRLRQDMQRVDTNYVEYVKKQAPYRENKAEMNRKFSGMNNIYFNQMLLTCASPLRDGVGLDSIVECMAMYMSMRIVNKDFRDRVDHMANRMKYDRLAKKAEKDGPDSLAAKSAKALQREIKMYNNGGREPLTAHSAALMKIGMTEQAYIDMRQPGADIEKIKMQYADAMGVLDEQCSDDGVKASDVNKQMRIIVGQYSDSNQAHADIYRELSYEGVGRAPYHRNPNNPNQMIWTGEYMDFDGNMFSGAFSPREPLSVESAAKIKLDMTMRAYENMRRDGADIDAFSVQYDESMATLSRMCQADGIDEQAVNQQMRLQIGEEMRRNPSFGNIFRELSYDGVEKAPPHRDPNNPGRATWTGEYVTRDGSPFNGQFTPREPMSQDEAARLKLDLIVDAHAAMREPGADSDAVMRGFQRKMSNFSKQCTSDGLNEHDVNQQIRIMIGEQCDRTPEVAIMFEELSSGAVTRVAPHADALNPGGTVWTGEYKAANGKSYNGAFTPRQPVSYDDHMKGIEQTAVKQFKQVKSADDMYALLRSYVNASASVFGNRPVSDVDAQRPEYRSISMDMQRMRADCTYDDSEVAYLQGLADGMPDSYRKSQLLSRVGTYQAANESFSESFDAEFDIVLAGAQKFVPKAVRKEFDALYGSPKDVMDVMRSVNWQMSGNDGPASKSPWQIYDMHMNAMERSTANEFPAVKTAGDLHGLLSGYVSAYAHIKDGVPLTKAEMQNPAYQAAAQRIAFMIDDCGADSDVMRDFESEFVEMLQTASDKVPPMVYQEFEHVYNGEPSDIVTAMKKQYRDRQVSAGPSAPPVVVDDVRVRPARGHENDVPSGDLSSKGRGADAARRLGVEFGDDAPNSGKDYSV